MQNKLIQSINIGSSILHNLIVSFEAKSKILNVEVAHAASPKLVQN